MTDNQIADIILNDLKTKSPRFFIKEILAPRHLWDITQEQRMKNIIALLTNQNLITAAGKYFPATDIQLTITGQGLDVLNRFNSYSSYLKSSKKPNAIISVLMKYWWKVMVPILVTLIALAIEYKWFVKK